MAGALRMLVGARVRVLASVLALVAGACRPTAPGVREWRASDHSRQPGEPSTPQGALPTDDDPLLAARALWASQCSNCHGTDGSGNGPAVSPMVRPPDMTAGAWQRSKSDAELALSIRNGKGMMPAFGAQVGPAGTTALVQLVRSMQH